MDRIAEWRPVDPAGPEGAGQPEEQTRQARTSRLTPAVLDLLQLAGVGLLAVAATASLGALAIAGGQPLSPPQDGVSVIVGSADPSFGQKSAATSSPAADLVVDVQGAVERPGLHRLPAGSRVGDAITAAGGYSAQVDIAAAALAINLAAVATDGQQVRVPLRGESARLPPTGAPGGIPSATGLADGLVNVNTAGEAQLDALPGVGPVTVGKIIAARTEAPFASIDDLVDRKVLGTATLEKIRELITVGP